MTRPPALPLLRAFCLQMRNDSCPRLLFDNYRSRRAMPFRLVSTLQEHWVARR